MKKSINNKFYFMLTTLAIAFLFCLSGFGLSFANTNADEYTTLNSATLTYVAYDRNNPNSSSNPSINNTSYSQYSWNVINKLTLDFANNGEIKPTTGTTSYTYSLDVDYAPIYVSDLTNFQEHNEHVTIQNVYTNTVASLDEIRPFEYYIDCHADDADITIKEIKEGISQKSHKDYGFGWGVYRFTFHIQGNNTSGYECISKYLYVAPTTPSAIPVVEYNIVSSLSGLQNAYEFYIVNSSDSGYQYADQNLIVWYARGIGTNDVNYVYSAADVGLKIGNEYPFTGYDTPIFTGNTDRNGTTFYFDPNGIAGSWEVFCVIYDIDHTSLRFQSAMQKDIKTGTKVEASIIIWIIIGCAVALLAIIVAIIVITKKKEKVW